MRSIVPANMASRARLAATTAVLALGLSLPGPWCPPAQALEDTQKFQTGERAPDFTLKDIAGNEVRLSDYQGRKVVLLVFFALRCSTCQLEAPYLEELHQKYKDKGAVVLSVNTDGVDAATAVEAMNDIGLETTYTILLDPHFTVTDTYTNFLVPLTLVIDRKGIIRFIHTGFDPGEEKTYEEAIKQVL